jgi:acyl dehydratase
VAQPQVGDKAARTRTVRERDIELFTELTGDRNPLHYDREAAADSRFGGIIVQGGVTSGLLNAVVAEDLPGPGSVFLHVEWDFKAPVRPGDEITAEVEVLEARRRQAAHEAAHDDHQPGRHDRARRLRAGLDGAALTTAGAGQGRPHPTCWWSSLTGLPTLRKPVNFGR